jgi:hypothetical protein
MGGFTLLVLLGATLPLILVLIVIDPNKIALSSKLRAENPAKRIE